MFLAGTNVYPNSFNAVLNSELFQEFQKRSSHQFDKDVCGCSYFGEIYQLFIECNQSIRKTFENHTQRWVQQARFVM